MSSKNREYQATHIEAIIDKVQEVKKVIAQLPTGGGKTQEFVSISQRFVYKTDQSVLILVHRKELMAQAKKRFNKVMGIDPILITSKTTRYARSKVYIGMVNSVVSRLDCFDNVGLLIIDECHQAEFNKVHSIFIDALVIGFTATPVSSNKREPLNKFYNAIVCGPQIPELIKLGFLAQNFSLNPTDIVDQAYLESNVDNRKGDINENIMAAAFSKPKYIINTVKKYRQYCKGQKTIVFNVNIAHSKAVCEFFNQCGFEARHIDSDDDSNRDETLKWFKETKGAILCNVGITTTGYDEPTVDWIILNFSTISPSKFIQCSGRGSRIIDEEFIEEFQCEYPYTLEIKTHFGILDLGGNGMRFGDWNNERDWEMLYNYPDEPGTGVAPSKTCPACEGLVHAAKHTCDCIKQPATKDENGEYILCGHVFDRKKAAEEDAIGEMMLITRGIDYEELHEKYKNKYDFFTFEKMSEQVVREIFFDNNNPSQQTLDKGFTYYFSLCRNWWSQFIAPKQYIKDITNSQFHIDKAKYCYKAAIEKYKKKNEVYNQDKCRYCSNQSVKHCNDCDMPVCDQHSAGESCIHCANVLTLS